MRYYFGAEARLRRAVEDTAMSVFDGWSYEEITTPSVDYYALFERGMGHLEAHRAFRFTDADGQLLALRPDVTSSIARAAATLLAQRRRPLRLCYAAPVFSQQPQSHARWRRESAQLGCELIGSSGTAADLEVLAIAVEVLARLRLQPGSCITLNSVEIFNGIAERLALDHASRDEMRRLVDMRDADELERFLTPHAPSAEAAAFARLVRLSGKREILDEARRVITNERSVAALGVIEELWRVLEALGLEDGFEIDLGDVAGLDYYTGLTFKVYVPGAGTRAGGGGRYDGLTANFGRPEPAVGFVLDLDALTDVLIRGGPDASDGPRDDASPIAAGDVAALLREARDRRAAGRRVRLEAAD
jgi:ATP phosphoribosyltransferase regulatory subunit